MALPFKIIRHRFRLRSCLQRGYGFNLSQQTFLLKPQSLMSSASMSVTQCNAEISSSGFVVSLSHNAHTEKKIGFKELINSCIKWIAWNQFVSYEHRPKLPCISVIHRSPSGIADAVYAEDFTLKASQVISLCSVTSLLLPVPRLPLCHNSQFSVAFLCLSS